VEGTILKLILKKSKGEGVEWILLTQDRDRYWALVNTVINLWVP
jgi:hypothetical protein